MNILDKIKEYSLSQPEQAAMQWQNQKLTYGELELYSSRLAAYIERVAGSNKEPVAVYGHKHPFMLVCFLALVKSGRGYCPIDVSVPHERVDMILDTLDSDICFALEPLSRDDKHVITLEHILNILKDETEEIAPDKALKDKDVYYMIFTSGSTGVPKGVMITRGNLEHYLDWSVTLGTSAEDKRGKVFLNQAPFSFDLSVMDLYTCLVSGGTLWALDKGTQQDYKALYESLGESDVSVFVSTPSFAEICMSDPLFSETLLPKLDLFLFCGETLTNQTAKKLRKRFPKAVIMNTYGPTESTVAVTEVLVDDLLMEEVSPLPVGRAKPGTIIEICDDKGNVLPEGEKGEIHILGDTVSKGYYKNPEGTEKAFYQTVRNGKNVAGYRTGDEGYLQQGMLYYCGRIDLQIKLHGYRIEIEDIENNIVRLPGVRQAVVVPNIRKGAVKSLTGYVVADDENRNIREELEAFLPSYMIPKKIVFMEQIPMTNNGKADRKQLGGLKP